MKARDLYRILDSQLANTFADLGLRKLRSTRLAYQEHAGDKYRAAWFQCDKYGWDAHSGGKFFVNFTVSQSDELDSPARREERLNYFLSDDELESARRLQNEIIGRIPKPHESYFQNFLTAFGKTMPAESANALVSTMRGYFEPEQTPFRRHQDFALRYWQPDDVVAWSSLIQRVIPRAMKDMQSW